MKFLLLLAVLVAIAWFAPAPVRHVESVIDISAPRDHVWSILSDVTGARLWDRQMRDATIVSEAKTGVGTERSSAAGPVVRTREKVTEWLAFNRLEFQVDHEPDLTKFETSRIELEPSGATGTKVRWAIDYQMNGGFLGDLFDRLALGSAHKGRIDDGLSRLKRYAETGDVTP